MKVWHILISYYSFALKCHRVPLIDIFMALPIIESILKPTDYSNNDSCGI